MLIEDQEQHLKEGSMIVKEIKFKKQSNSEELNKMPEIYRVLNLNTNHLREERFPRKKKFVKNQ